jgi:hypothetical protein
MQGQHATLVVIEFGAHWPRWLDPSALGDIAVVAQHYEGAPHSMVAQVENRLTRLMASHWLIESAIFVSNGRTDLESLGARSILARGLLAHLKKTNGKRLVLAVSPERGERACKTLSALADTLQSGALEAGIELLLATTENPDGPAARALLSSDARALGAALAEISGFDSSKVPLLGSGTLGVC